MFRNIDELYISQPDNGEQALEIAETLDFIITGEDEKLAADEIYAYFEADQEGR